MSITELALVTFYSLVHGTSCIMAMSPRVSGTEILELLRVCLHPNLNEEIGLFLTDQDGRGHECGLNSFHSFLCNGLEIVVNDVYHNDGRIVEIKSEKHEELVKWMGTFQHLLIILFYYDASEPCKDAMQKYVNFSLCNRKIFCTKLNIMHLPASAQHAATVAIPSFKVYRNGKILSKLIGSIPNELDSFFYGLIEVPKEDNPFICTQTNIVSPLLDKSDFRSKHEHTIAVYNSAIRKKFLRDFFECINSFAIDTFSDSEFSCLLRLIERGANGIRLVFSFFLITKDFQMLVYWVKTLSSDCEWNLQLLLELVFTNNFISEKGFTFLKSLALFDSLAESDLRAALEVVHLVFNKDENVIACVESLVSIFKKLESVQRQYTCVSDKGKFTDVQNQLSIISNINSVIGLKSHSVGRMIKIVEEKDLSAQSAFAAFQINCNILELMDSLLKKTALFD